MVIHNKIRKEKLQYDINMVVAKISLLSSVKIKNYEYFFTGKNILPLQQHRIIEEAIITYSLLGRQWENEEKQLKRREENNSKL